MARLCRRRLAYTPVLLAAYAINKQEFLGAEKSLFRLRSVEEQMKVSKAGWESLDGGLDTAAVVAEKA